MLKLAGLLLLFSSSVLTGFYAAAALDDREQMLHRQLSFWRQFSLQLGCLRSSPKQLVHMLAAQQEFAGDRFVQRLDGGFEESDSFRVALQKAIKATPAIKDGGIAELLLPLGDIIGLRDIENQLAAIASVVLLLEEKRETARTACQQKGSLYRRLGVMGGLMLAVFFW